MKYNVASELIKTANAKHKGIFFYVNRNKKLGIHHPAKSGGELIKLKKTMKMASKKAKARGRG